jgi:preprotein translocase subunit SecD
LLTLVAIPSGVMISEGQPLPAGSQIIAGPDDFDAAATTITPDGAGSATVTIRLRRPAIERVAGHTAAHVGDLIAIVLNGRVIAVPMVMEPIVDGEVRIAEGSLGADLVADRFAACVR